MNSAWPLEGKLPRSRPIGGPTLCAPRQPANFLPGLSALGPDAQVTANDVTRCIQGISMESKILRLPAVLAATGKSRSAIYADVVRGLFPAPVRLGQRAVGWREDEVAEWLNSRVSTRPSIRQTS